VGLRFRIKKRKRKMFCFYGLFLVSNNTAVATAILMAITLIVMNIIKSVVFAKLICTACGVDTGAITSLPWK
jgi:hypothetical protein